MVRGTGWRLAAGVFALVGASLAMLLGLLVILFAGVMGAFDANSGVSAALTGGLVLLLGLLAVPAAGLYFLPKTLPAITALAVTMAMLLWAFSRLDATTLALIPVMPLAFSVLCGLAALNQAPANPSSVPAGR